MDWFTRNALGFAVAEANLPPENHGGTWECTEGIIEVRCHETMAGSVGRVSRPVGHFRVRDGPGDPSYSATNGRPPQDSQVPCTITYWLRQRGQYERLSYASERGGVMNPAGSSP